MALRSQDAVLAPGGELGRLLASIRRRLRLFAAAEGAVAGTAVGLAALALAVALVHHRGGAVAVLPATALVAASAVAGAAVRAARRITLTRCARFADAALDGEDQVLSALWLGGGAGSAADGPWVRALVAAATARARRLTPAAAVPARRPKHLPLLAAGAAALAIAALLPARTRAARPIGSPAIVAAGTPVSADALDTERDAARAAAEAARTLDNATLGALARELGDVVRRLTRGQLAEGEALDHLKALEARAADAARSAERERAALQAAERALSDAAATQAASAALQAAGADGRPGGDQAARAALGDAAGRNPTETASALAAAAQGVSAAAGGAGEEGAKGANAREQRRLQREHDQATPDPAAQGGSAASGSEGRKDGDAAEPDRRLERLSRDLDEASRACRAGDPDCRAQAEQRGSDLARLSRDARGGEALRQLERALHQMRSRIGRGELRDGARAGQDSAMRGFMRAARGAQGQNGQASASGNQDSGGGNGAPSGRQSPGAGTPTGEANGAVPSQAGAPGRPGGASAGGNDQESGGNAAEGAGPGERGDQDGRSDGRGESEANAEQGRGAQDGTGDGIGHAPGGAPLGRADGARGANAADRAHDSEAKVANGAGPSRPEVIGTAAGKGFTSPGYARVFSDYQSAVEDALSATAVPEGRRYTVRRYFDLIRPRR